MEKVFVGYLQISEGHWMIFIYFATAYTTQRKPLAYKKPGT